MWRGPTLISFLAGFLFPPLWILTVYLLWQESKGEDRATAMRDIRSATLANLYNTSPAGCESCGGNSFTGGIIRTVPAMDLRSFQFPIEGVASVCRFRCNQCGSVGRYAIAHKQAENGWILVGSQMMGY